MRPYKRDPRLSARLKGMLHQGMMAKRRKTVYRLLMKKHGGMVPCFVCGKHVKWDDATNEHIKPKSKGGTDAIENLAISHYRCNQRRGDNETYVHT